MKCLTICEPYATLIATGRKRVENRTWPTPYRGPLLIHAGLNRSYLQRADLAAYGLRESDLTFGAIVAVADLAGCPTIGAARGVACVGRWPWLRGHDHTEGPYCWVLENVRRLARPVPYRGAQGLFDVPESVIANLV